MGDISYQIVLYANGIIMSGMLYYAFTCIFKPAVRDVWIILIFLAFAFAAAHIFLLFDNVWVTFISNIAGYVALSFLFSGNRSTKIIFSILLYVTLVVAELLAVVLLSILFYIQYGTGVTLDGIMPVARTVTTIIHLPFIMALIQIFRRYVNKKAVQGNFKVPVHYTIIVAVVLFGVLMLSVLFLLATINEIHGVFIELTISLLLSAGVIIAVIWLYNTILNHLEEFYKNRQKDQMLERWEVLYNTATSTQNAMSTLKHNMRYDLLSISSCLEENDVSKAKKLITDRIGGVESVFSTGNTSIDTMLNYYQQKALETLDISLVFKHLIPPNLHIDTNLIALILGNALENAVEACSTVPKEQRHIKVIAEITARSDLLITIINPYSIPPVSDDEGNLISIKEDKQNHGLGLSSIRDILDEDIGQVHHKYKDGEFRFMLIYYKVLL
ncbi:MAG: ATP-binding protein [Oscillospiraceae bacterium]|nr:ATP-binding protein [Oscillospiraceae bacterium]MCL2279628.1 ATP-binding protein [Oscillospiraceae bacterium]